MTLLSEAEVMQTKLCVHGKANVHNWSWNRWDQIKEEGGKFCIPQDQPTPPPIPQIIKSHYLFIYLFLTMNRYSLKVMVWYQHRHTSSMEFFVPEPLNSVGFYLSDWLILTSELGSAYQNDPFWRWDLGGFYELVG